MRIIANHVCAINTLAATSANSLDHTMLHSSYKNTISLTHILYSSKNLTDQFAALATKNEDLLLERDATITNYNYYPHDLSNSEKYIFCLV
jgi:hypothetical protein